MKKIFGLCSLVIINCFTLYLLYKYIEVICSTRIDNFLHIPYEPSGFQMIYYFISLPFFLLLAILSQMHSYYFDLKKSLFPGIFIIWTLYLALILYVDFIGRLSNNNSILYWGTWIISLIATFYIAYVFCCEFIQFIKIDKN
ncbi:hypothetical protein [Legionella rowbothamii]|uniref:hypothetical protein n=1 Tax=Legionella rowbothamii TaxID=96229 RepID=UPI001055F75F|nr:hypothetical protein [Legionella rowbothamii]